MGALCQQCENHPVWKETRQDILVAGRTVRSLFTDSGPAGTLFRVAKNRGNRRALDILLERRPLSTVLPPGSRILVPVPPSKGRLIRRGLSIPDILATALSRTTGIPVTFSGLVRTKDTPQKGLNRLERKSAILAPPFRRVRMGRPDLPTDGLVLVDDLIATGSTLRAIDRLLREEEIGVLAYASILFRTSSMGQ